MTGLPVVEDNERNRFTADLVGVHAGQDFQWSTDTENASPAPTSADRRGLLRQAIDRLRRSLTF